MPTKAEVNFQVKVPSELAEQFHRYFPYYGAVQEKLLEFVKSLVEKEQAKERKQLQKWLQDNKGTDERKTRGTKSKA